VGTLDNQLFGKNNKIEKYYQENKKIGHITGVREMRNAYKI